MEGPDIISSEAIIDNGKFGKRVVRFETGVLAQQADGSVTTYLDDDSMILSTVTAGSAPKDSYDFFPLTVEVQEKMYSAGKIPGSFFRREGKPSTQAILACRLIDRPLRPLFPHTLRNEVQIIETVLSLDPEDAYDTIALNAASAATCISGIPFEGPVGGVRLALIDGQWVAFPRWSEREKAVFEIVIAGRVTSEDDVAIAMIEAGAGIYAWDLIQDGAQKPDEEVVAQGLEAAKPFIRTLCEAQVNLRKKVDKELKIFELFPEYTEEIYNRVDELSHLDLDEALSISDKLKRQETIESIKEHVRVEMAEEFSDMDPDEKEREISNAFKALQRSIVRYRILTQDYRIDGRGLSDIRTLSAEVDIVPRVHGSALFQRGETQVIGITTLGMLKMAQLLDPLSGPETQRYMHQYNMPPFSTGEAGRIGSPKRREIGHGALAEKALFPVIPSEKEFPYSIRQVSEAIGSNGSTSMASVCTSTLSLLAAGVPIKAPVAGIAMGLVSGEVDGKVVYKTLTDILGAEDAFGDMDFKVAGTADFITALQLDTKLDGIPADILASALKQAHEARTILLSVINECIDSPAPMAKTAPRIITVEVPVDKIGEIIGPKGKTINEIQEKTGAEISIEDDGTVYIASSNGDEAEEARMMVENIVHPHIPEVGETVEGTVVKVTSFGAFVNIAPNTDGLLHISQIRHLRNGDHIERVEDVLNDGDTVTVTVQGIDDRGKISLAIPGAQDDDFSSKRGSARQLSYDDDESEDSNYSSRDSARSEDFDDDDDSYGSPVYRRRERRENRESREGREGREERSRDYGYNPFASQDIRESNRPARGRRSGRYNSDFDDSSSYSRKRSEDKSGRSSKSEGDQRDFDFDFDEDMSRGNPRYQKASSSYADRDGDERGRRSLENTREGSDSRGARGPFTRRLRNSQSRSQNARKEREEYGERAVRRSSRSDRHASADDISYQEYRDERIERSQRPRRRVMRNNFDEDGRDLN